MALPEELKKLNGNFSKDLRDQGIIKQNDNWLQYSHTEKHLIRKFSKDFGGQRL
jgi:hypothetical protein